MAKHGGTLSPSPIQMLGVDNIVFTARIRKVHEPPNAGYHGFKSVCSHLSPQKRNTGLAIFGQRF